MTVKYGYSSIALNYYFLCYSAFGMHFEDTDLSSGSILIEDGSNVLRARLENSFDGVGGNIA